MHRFSPLLGDFLNTVEVVRTDFCPSAAIGDGPPAAYPSTKRGRTAAMTGCVCRSSQCLSGVHPMCILTAFRRLVSAATVYCGPHGAVQQLADQRETSR